MEVIVRPTADAAAALTAALIAARVRAEASLVLGLATRRTMERVYDRLAAMELDFSGCRSFNLDEYIGVPPDDEHSYRRYMDQHLFSRVNIAGPIRTYPTAWPPISAPRPRATRR
jgi:glucosamine-6-phosphate deaminase